MAILLVSVVFQPPLTAAGSSEEKNGDHACPGPQWVEGIGRACRRPDGLWQVFDSEGGPMGLTHGQDPVPAQAESHWPSVPPRAPKCVDAGDPYYAHVIYARAHDDADGFATMEADLRDLIHEVNGLLYHDATTAGSARDYKVHCTSGVVTIENEVLPTNKSSAGFSTIVEDLRAKGYDDRRVKYWVWYDDTGACSCGGTAHVYNDDTLREDNRNNGRTDTISMYAVTFGYLSPRIMAHENGHNMGAVQHSSPNASGGFHCNDGHDVMCYSDGGTTSAYDSTVCATSEYDCNKDDYFHPKPPAGYLLEHWNIGNPINRFLHIPGDNTAPYMVAVTCAPDPAEVGASVSCTVQGGDADSKGIHYTLDWGDGSSTSRLPKSGTLIPGKTASASHAYSTSGLFDVTVTATDDAATPLTSTAMVHTQQVGNVAPAMKSLSCTPEPVDAEETVTCSFHADDSSSGVHYLVDWGDGTAAERVPTTGYLTPGTTASAARSFSSPDIYTVRVNATDDDPEPLTSADITTTVTVEAANGAPVMQTLSCAPSHLAEGETVDCSFSATDDTTGVYYTVEWGDGSVERVPTTGLLASGSTASASHAYSGGADPTVQVRATDNDPEPKTSTALASTLTVNGAPVVTGLSCSPSTLLTGETTTCTFAAEDDSTSVSFTVEWGDGAVTTLGATTAGTSRSVGHSYTTSGPKTIKVTATDDDTKPLSGSATFVVEVQDPCGLHRTGRLTVGLLGVQMVGTSARDETGIRSTCAGQTYSLVGSSGSDFNVCWYDGSRLLVCHVTPGDEHSVVPSGADRARVVLYTGVDATYTLEAFD
ncbi:MAG: PKD domain-containing protein [Euryarchaeota archaeon]|nr:PKD domain-containing protein [Euryarchaeota archaeon]